MMFSSGKEGFEQGVWRYGVDGWASASFVALGAKTC